VIESCAYPPRQGSWISPEFIEAYTKLHEVGVAHSVECWAEDELVGGIYGVAVGGLFAGESMFHHADHASKLALHYLVEHLKSTGFRLFDIQMVTPVTQMLGATQIARNEYLRRLKLVVDLPCKFLCNRTDSSSDEK
jgi:leucyl/phenylalanyl-tRNA--protein transferase